jgi:dolichyl-phosphate beta-glucosyltransferase
MSSIPLLSVIIPAHNEAKRLPLTLIDIDRHLSKVDFSYEIIVVDNHSSDATPEIVKRFSSIIKNLILVEEKQKGKGAAVRTGMLQAKGEIRLFTDADNSTSIDQIFKMLPYLRKSGINDNLGDDLNDEEYYDIVIASRDVEGAQLIPAQAWYRRIAGDIGNFIIRILLLPGIFDTQCGFKVFSKEAAENIFSIIRIKGWAFDVEVLALAKKMGYRIKEVPVVWVNNPFSLVNWKAYLIFLVEVLKIKWWMLNFKKYYNINSL